MLPPKRHPQPRAAADAFAEGDECGIGGWFLPPGAPDDAASAFWFSLRLKSSDFPDWLDIPQDGNLQTRIACFETLAQTALLLLRQSCGDISHGRVILEQFSDNAPSVAGLNRLRSNSWPLALFIMHFAAWAFRFRLIPVVNHIPGKENDWADGLSRGFPETLTLFREDRRFHVSAAELWSPSRGERIHSGDGWPVAASEMFEALRSIPSILGLEPSSS